MISDEPRGKIEQIVTGSIAGTEVALPWLLPMSRPEMHDDLLMATQLVGALYLLVKAGFELDKWLWERRKRKLNLP